MPVPAGFVITTRSFQRFVEFNQLAGPIQNQLARIDLSDNGSLEQAGKAIRDMIAFGLRRAGFEVLEAEDCRTARQKVADRLREYALQVCNAPSDRIFPITYEAARMMVIKSGKLVGVKLRPHDLRRHSATYASRSGVPIEIISKVILRHANLSTTQRYLGTISDVEAIRWIENIYG